MNTLQKSLIAIAAGSLLSVGAQAAVYGTGAYVGQPYVGAKIGQYNPDVNDADVEKAMSYGVYGGYKFVNNFGVEGEYLTTNKADADKETKSFKAEYSADVLGLYGTYDYAFPNTGVYAKGRLGVAKNKIEVEETDKAKNHSDTVSLSDTGVAGGLGVGYNITPNASIEGMYNFYPKIDGKDGADDIKSNGLTVGAHFKF